MSEDTSEEHLENSAKEKGVSLTEGNLLYSKLQCVQCGKCLSVKPVSEKDGRYMCGRCCPEAKQCQLYAAVAEHFIFPCIFRDCEAELRWGDVHSHEKACFYRDVSCPFSECIGRYQFISYQSHLEEIHSLHKQKYLSDTLTLEKLTLSTPYVNLHCIFHKGNTFLVFIKIYRQICCGRMKGICEFSVFYLASEVDLSNLNCKIKIINSDINVVKCINGNDFEEFIDTQHCLGCLNEFCDKPDHTNSGDSFLTDDLEFSTKRKTFSYAIEISKKKCVKALPNIECPICNNDFNELICLCPTGHSLCFECYQNVNECPFCRKALPSDPIRNFAFEELIRDWNDSDSN